MVAAVLPHQLLAERLVEALDDGDVEYARLEFPASLVPLRDDLDEEDDDMIAMDFVVDESGLRVLGLVSYTDFTSDECEDAPSRPEWTLYDEQGVPSFTVIFHDTDDPDAWIVEHGVLTVVPRVKDEEALEAEYGPIVADLIIG